jgi:hypothetical protein
MNYAGTETLTVPMQLAVYEHMLDDEAAIVPNSSARVNQVAAFLHEGLHIQAEQCVLIRGVGYGIDPKNRLKTRKLVSRLAVHFTETMNKEINGLRTKLDRSIAKWRRTQKLLTPLLEEHLDQQKGCLVEQELLGLPSELTAGQRVELNIDAFTRTEADLREGAAYDAVAKVKVVTKALRTLRDRKKKNDSGVYKNTISQKQINDAERRRDLHIAGYMAARQALIALEMPNAESDFPVLEAKDTFLKSRSMSRQLGDSRVADGSIWTGAGIGVGGRRPQVASTSAGVSTAASSAAGPSFAGSQWTGSLETGMQRRKGKATDGRERSTASLSKPIQSKKPPRKEGWLWSFKPKKMSDEELDKWNNEGV